MDVFRGQMTEQVLTKLRENSVFLVRVPVNMTNLFQALDLIVNGAAKAFLKKKYTEWYSGEIAKALDDGMEIDDIDIKLKLSILKPVQAKWIVELYYYLTSEKGHEVIANGWKSAGIIGAIEGGLLNLANLDPFAAIDPLEHSSVPPLIENGNLDQVDISSFVTYSDDGDVDEESRDIEGNQTKNIFEIIADDICNCMADRYFVEK